MLKTALSAQIPSGSSLEQTKKYSKINTAKPEETGWTTTRLALFLNPLQKSEPRKHKHTTANGHAAASLSVRDAVA